MSSTQKQKIKHLGRGLQSLLSPITTNVNNRTLPVPISEITPNSSTHKHLRHSILEIDVEAVQPNPYQPRTTWDKQQLEALADSIKSNGLIQPIIVRSTESGYQLVSGERRLRAARIASLRTIPAVVREASDNEMLELALVENLHRADLNPIERAKAYRNYLQMFSFTQTEAANRLAEDRSVIANHLRLLELPDDIREMLTDGRLTMGHARALLGLPTDQLRRTVANKAVNAELSVRAVEKLVRAHLAKSGESQTEPREKPAHILDLETTLGSELATKVSIETRKNGRKGKIIIEFYSLDDFDRIIEKLGLTAVRQA